MISRICERCGGILNFNQGDTLVVCKYCEKEQFLFEIGEEKVSLKERLVNLFRKNKGAENINNIQLQIYKEIKEYLRKNRMRVHRYAIDVLKTVEHKENKADFLENHKEDMETLKKEVMFLHLYDWFEKAENYWEFDILERLYQSLDGYLNSKIMAKECYSKVCELGYNEAKKLSIYPTAEKHKQALEILKRIKGYRDSDVMAEMVKNKIYELEREELYIRAMNCKVECSVKSLSEAIVILDKISNYRDAKKQKDICKNLLAEMEQTELKKTELRRFSEKSQGHFQDYRRSSDELKWTIQRKDRIELINQMKADVQNNIVTFGHHDGRPLEWFLVEGSEKFIKLICVENIHQLGGKVVTPADYAWQDSNIRHWLNDEFYNDFFTETERMLMVSTGRDFERVFSFDEAPRLYDKIYIINKREYTRNSYRIQSFRNSGLFEHTLSPWLLCSSVSVRHYIDQKGEVKDLYSEKTELTAHPMITLDIRDN